MKYQDYPTSAITDGDAVLGYRTSDGQMYLLTGIQSQGTSAPQVTVKELSSANILSLNTPFLLLDSPSDTDKYYDVEKIIFEFDPGTTNYVLSDPIEIRGAFIADVSAGLITSSTNKTAIVRAQTAPVVSIGTGAALTISTDSAPTTGNGTLRVIVFYTLRTFGE